MTREEELTANSAYPKVSVKWLIELSASYQILCLVDREVPLNSLLPESTKSLTTNVIKTLPLIDNVTKTKT